MLIPDAAECRIANEGGRLEQVLEGPCAKLANTEYKPRDLDTHAKVKSNQVLTKINLPWFFVLILKCDHIVSLTCVVYLLFVKSPTETAQSLTLSDVGNLLLLLKYFG